MSTFKGKTLMTQGFANQVPLEVQMLIMSMLAEHVSQSVQSNTEVDYLQVFNLKAKGCDQRQIQEITHSQEVPSYERQICVQVTEAINEKIFVISDDYGEEGEVITALLASEY